ncbi:MAG: serine hydrolase [Propionibacteriaceae bacterium]
MTNETSDAPAATSPGGRASYGGAASLPRSTPPERGLDPAAVGRFLDAVQARGVELHSLMLVRHGSVVAEGWWAPYEPSGLHLLYSLSKSFTATAVGLAVEERRLSVDDLVTSFFPGRVPSDVHPYVAQLKVRDLLSMATGHHEDTLERVDRHDLVRSFLALPPEEEPGTWFTYNNGATLMLSAIVTKLTGERVLDYLRPRLLEPLGITDAYWQQIPDGDGGDPDLRHLDLGFSGLHLATESIAKFGQLFLSRGVWQGEQLVAEDWVRDASRVQVDNPREPEPDWRQGYGYQFWMGREGYRGDGAFGQFCIVLPDVDTVLALTSATENMQAILDCVWSELYPALQSEDGGTGEEASAELQARLGVLTLPLATGDHNAGIELPWLAASPTTGRQEGTTRIESIEEAADGWRLTLADEHATYAVGCGFQTWARSEVEVWPGARLQVAASGAWSDPTTFTAEVAMVQTPHRLTLTCDTATGSTTAQWNVAPLGPTSPSALAFRLADD